MGNFIRSQKIHHQLGNCQDSNHNGPLDLTDKPVDNAMIELFAVFNYQFSEDLLELEGETEDV